MIIKKRELKASLEQVKIRDSVGQDHAPIVECYGAIGAERSHRLGSGGAASDDYLQKKIKELELRVEDFKQHASEWENQYLSLEKEVKKLKEENAGLISELIGQEHRLGSKTEILERENANLTQNLLILKAKLFDLLNQETS
jgi:predicted RNase H-like nuclease (RuvC/YqgF family)